MGHMKKIVLIFILSLLAISCTLTNEQRAELLIEEIIKENLYHPDSYEPIKTHVDSMFIDSSTIGPMIEIQEELKDLLVKVKSCENKIESAESSMDIWAPDVFSTKYSRGQYERAQKDKIEAEKNLSKINKKVQEYIAELKDNVEKFHKNEFTGWIVFHRYRGLNGAGTMTIPSDMVFFFDIDFQSCHGYEYEKFEKIIELIQIVEDTDSCDDDILDYIEENKYSIF